MTGRLITAVGMTLALPALCLLSDRALGGFTGAGFDKPAIPTGAHLNGPASKGTMSYTVNGSVAQIAFRGGKCGNTSIAASEPINVSSTTDVSAFATASGKAVADALEGFFLSYPLQPTALNVFIPCYGTPGPGFLGIYVTAVNKTNDKGPTYWTGEVTLQGVRF